MMAVCGYNCRTCLKTYLAAATANTLVAGGRVVLLVTAPELVAMIRDGFDTEQVDALFGYHRVRLEAALIRLRRGHL